MKTKMNRHEVIRSILTFFCCYLGLMLDMFIMLTIVSDGHVTSFIKAQVNGVITVTVATALIAMVIYCYFLLENPQVLIKVSKSLELFFVLALSLFLCNLIGKFIDTTACPLLFCALMLVMLFRRRDAIFVNFAFALEIFIFNRFLNGTEMGGSVLMIQSLASLMTSFCCGTFGIFVIKSIKTRIGSVMVAFILLAPVVVMNIVMQLTATHTDVGKNILQVMLYSSLDCVFSVLLFLFFLPIFEVVFSELTPFRLRELTSPNAKLVKKLKENAPGTYTHSIVVAQLAEACASAIGEDSELARAAAYYHDMGKLKNPEMFAENQSEYDLHQELTPELSVDIIRAHARDGAKLIRRHRLPEFFADVAIQHHGTLPIKYFYAKALRMSDGELNAGGYSYSGPTPATKIAAIIMIVDASEAATRSLPDRSPEKIEALVSSIIEERMNLDQFADCNITMRDLTIITRTVVNSLTGVYHSRVQYPKLVLSKKK